MKPNKNKHLTLQDRQFIQTAIENGSKKSSIADSLGKDKSTIGKEIKLHRRIFYKCSLPLECAAYKKCKHNRNCKLDCPDYKPFKCSRRDRSPGACNGCSQMNKCRFTKFKYIATQAHSEYEDDLVGTRQGFNLTTGEAAKLFETVAPLIRKGQSPDQILMSHPELNICVQTLYTYIESGVLKKGQDKLGPLDLRRQVSRRLPKNKRQDYKKREDRTYLKERLYKDYMAYMNVEPNVSVVEMDTVYNDVSHGPFIQTFFFTKYSFIFAIYHEAKTAQEMYQGVLELEKILGEELFNEEVQVLLTDRGSEFVMANEIEFRENGERRTRLFYCDPMQSSQKPHVENKHTNLRFIMPKKVDLYGLGLQSQEAVNLMLSHVNSAPSKKLNGKSPIEYLKFLNPDLKEKFKNYGIVEISKDDVTLKPYLLRQK